MLKLVAPALAVMLATTLAGHARAQDDPAKVMGKLLDDLSERQNEQLAAVLAELRAECEEGDEPDACLVTALQSYLLKAAPEPAK